MIDFGSVTSKNGNIWSDSIDPLVSSFDELLRDTFHRVEDIIGNGLATLNASVLLV